MPLWRSLHPCAAELLGDSLDVPVGSIDDDAEVLYRVVDSAEDSRGDFVPVDGPIAVDGTQVISWWPSAMGSAVPWCLGGLPV